MSLQTFSIFLPACFAINMAFGPNNVLSLSNGARDGVRASVLASSGRIVAFAIMIAIAGLGLGALLLASQTLFTAIKLAGAAYLVWIGVKLMRSGPSLVVKEEGVARGPVCGLAEASVCRRGCGRDPARRGQETSGDLAPLLPGLA